MTLTKKSVYVFIAASLSMLVPTPGRFAFGIVLVLLLNILMLSGTVVRYCVMRLRIGRMANIFLIGFLIFVTMLYHRLLVFISPAMALQMGFVIYLPTVSSYFIGYIFGTKMQNLVHDIKYNMSHALIFSIFALLFFLLRDILGFGTFTYISLSGFHEIVLHGDNISAFSFLASIPGALICIASNLVLYLYVMDKIHIQERAA